MKKFVFCLILLSAVLIPLACGNSNNSPSGPIGGPTATKTPTPGGATNTPTPGGPTNTPTLTPTTYPSAPSPTPVFDANNGASSAANGAYYAGNSASGTIYVAENDGINPEVQEFTNTSGALAFSGGANFVLVSINGGSPTTVFLVGPQGFASTNIQVLPLPNPPTNYYAILDENASGGATLYSGTNFNLAGATANAWGTQVFKSPKCLTADTIGNFYVADTGNGYIEQWNMVSSPSQYPIHRWNDYYDFQTGTTATLIQPYAVACDPTAAGNVFVADVGVPNSRIIEFTSGGIAVASNGIFSGVSGCIVHGLAVDASDNVYVADSANHQIEEYGQVTGVWSLLRSWTIPVGTVVGGNYYEASPFNPTCISLTGVGVGSNIIVGDFTNQLLSVFGP